DPGDRMAAGAADPFDSRLAPRRGLRAHIRAGFGGRGTTCHQRQGRQHQAQAVGQQFLPLTGRAARFMEPPRRCAGSLASMTRALLLGLVAATTGLGACTPVSTVSADRFAADGETIALSGARAGAAYACI